MADVRRNYDIEELGRINTAHHFQPFSDSKAMAEDGGARMITSASGVYLQDGHGNRLLDGMAGLWCVNIGYGHKELAEVAAQQMMELPYYNTFFRTATPPVAELSAKVASLLPDNFNRVFFSNSGSEANDSNIRMVHHYWQTKGQPEKRFIISRDNAYHGSTVASATLGGMSAMHKQGGKLVPSIHHVMEPNIFKFGINKSDEEVGAMAAKALEDKVLELGPDNVAAFIGEPIQGAGGVIVPPANYWPEIQRICDQYDILLICDEVICGFGRTGNWFGFETLGIKPDLITMAKGLSSGYLPISAIAISDKVNDVVVSDGGEFAHGYTYSGHPAACAVALRNIEIIEREGLVEKVRNETGPYAQRLLKGLEDHPLVGYTRGVGMFGAFELVKNKETRERFTPAGKVGITCRDHIMRLGAIIRPCGEAMVFSPPLTIEKAELDELFGLIRQALDATAKDWGVM